MEKLNLAIIGQGRSGDKIHGAYYQSLNNKFYKVKYVVESDQARREKALKKYPGCKVFADYRDLMGVNDIDLVVNATYSNMHYPTSKALLQKGFNVLVEKPLAANVYECNSLIKIAKEQNVTLAVFQQTMFAPFYVFAKKVASSGKIGDIEQISIRYNRFSRRWDWQTLQKMLGGSCYNTGPHPIGIALDLLGFDKDARVVFSRLSNTPMSSGDADDYCKIIITAPSKPVVDIEISSIDAYSDYNIKLQGTRGTYKSTAAAYKLKHIAEGENPDRQVIETALADEDGSPMYCSENLKTHEEEGRFNGNAFDVGTAKLYEDLYFAIKNGTPPLYTAEKVKDIIGVIEKVHADNHLELKY